MKSCDKGNFKCYENNTKISKSYYCLEDHDVTNYEFAYKTLQCYSTITLGCFYLLVSEGKEKWHVLVSDR